MAFLPVTREEMKERGWEQPDFIMVTGDAYVDHPSFGHAIISRILERYGYKVAILAQPDWRDAESFTVFGKPRLGFLVNSGNVDSMVNHYTVFKRRRKTDFYTPGGQTGKRPDRAVIVYCNKIREAYKDAQILIGGIEASLRRFGHYDYWDDKIRRSILMDSQADLLMYGMGERAIVEIAEALDSGLAIGDITWIRGTCCKIQDRDFEDSLANDKETILLPSFNKISRDKKAYGDSFLIQNRNMDAISGKRLVEGYENGIYVIQNPPAEPLSSFELDDVYELPYERTYHPSYEPMGGVPAIQEVKFSLTANRGCFGGCSFCALTYHQGRRVQCRSKESLVKEAEMLIRDPEFKGYIHDVGGPTANFRRSACQKQLEHGVCKEKDCLYPKPCKHMEIDHREYLEILRELRNLPGIKKVFVRSGVRFDYAMADEDDTFIRELCKHHISGTLKVAPEHISDNVLRYMHKPEAKVFESFWKKYKKINEELNSKQFLIPYFISSHPGSTLEDACELAEFLKEHGFVPDQVQDFYPTPGTLSTCMYYTGYDPISKKSVYVATDMEEKRMQRAMLHFNKPQNRDLVRKALRKIKREDLIGYGPKCLVPPDRTQGKKNKGR